MEPRPNVIPMWNQKFIEGKMFERLCCDRCRTPFNFGQSARATRIPHCPRCGSMDAHPANPTDGRSAA